MPIPNTSVISQRNSLMTPRTSDLALFTGGWKVIPPAQSRFILLGISGVQVWVHPAAPDETRTAGSAAVALIDSEGIEAEIRRQNPKNPVETKIHLNVGTKP